MKIQTFGNKKNQEILNTSGNIVIQEKIDGANFGSFVKKGILNFCSHNTNSNYRDGKGEGVVIKSYENNMYAKIHDDSFNEIKTIKKPLVDMSTEMEIVEIYATDARIRKFIYEMRDDGFEFGMEMMKDLMKNVAEDILEEEILEIYKSYEIINIRKFNRLIGRKCAKVLSALIHG